MKNRRTALMAIIALALAAAPAHVLGAGVPAGGPDAREPAAADAQPAPAPSSAFTPRQQADLARKAERAREAERANAWFSAAEGEELTERIAKSFTAGPNPALVLSNIAGDITVTASTGNEIRLEAVKRVHAANEADARRQLEETRVEIDDRQGRLEVRTVHTRGKNHVAVDYVIVAPASMLLELRSVKGTIVVENIRGEVRAETVRGDVRATGLASESALKAVSGAVSVSSSIVAGNLLANSVSGDVLLKDCKARSLQVMTVSGGITLSAAKAERVMLKTVNGDIEMTGPFLKGGSYEFKSHSGTIRLFVDGKGGFEVEANSFGGEIRPDLPMTVRSSDWDDEHRPHRVFSAVFGDGSARVEVATFSGDVIIAKKQ